MTSPVLNYVIERYFKLTSEIEDEISDKFHEIISEFQWKCIQPDLKIIANIKMVMFIKNL